MKKKIVIVLNIAGLSPALLKKSEHLPNLTSIVEEGTYRKMIPSFPALTCSVQATLLSGKPPADHGIVGNGYFNRLSMRPEFWRQEDSLVSGPRIWDIMREKDPNAKVAVLFWQNSKYISADIVITPSPLHTDKGMIEWCYSKPKGLYEGLTEELGEFHLKDYWGPEASSKSSEWIATAGVYLLERKLPSLLLLYIPHLDYVCQRLHPNSAEVEKELSFIDEIAGEFINFREKYGRDSVVLFFVSEYGLVPVKTVSCPNRLLRESGLLKVREIGGREYIDFELSEAFAVVDHQIAHIYCKKKGRKKAKEVLSKAEGISSVLDRKDQREEEVHHNRSGEFIAVAHRDCWFAYYYWFDQKKAPFFAESVDIHRKPGYDPCELFFDPQKKAIPIKPELVKGSHGLSEDSDQQSAVMVCSDCLLDDYAPKPFKATQFLGMLYRVI